MKADFAWCETIAAGGVWHLRRLTSAGLKPNGGADSSTLCGLRPSWDIEQPVTDTSIEVYSKVANYGWYGRACPKCVEAYRAREGDAT